MPISISTNTFASAAAATATTIATNANTSIYNYTISRYMYCEKNDLRQSKYLQYWCFISWVNHLNQKTKQKNSEIYNWAGLNLWIYFINVSLKVYLFSRWSLTNQKSIKDLNFFSRIKLYLGTIKTDALDIFYSFYEGLIKYLPESSHEVWIENQHCYTLRYILALFSLNFSENSTTQTSNISII